MSLILLMPNPDNAKIIGDKLQPYGFTPDYICQRGADALSHAGNDESGVVICTQRFKDMNYLSLLEYLPAGFKLIVMSRDQDVDTSSGRVFLLINPFKTIDLVNKLKEVMDTSYKPSVKRVVSKARTPQEMQIIDEAKRLLMEKNGISEPEAFRFIQKSSMDSGRNMVESAQMVILLNR